MAREVILKGTALHPKLVNPEPVKVNGQPRGEAIYSVKLVLDADNDFALLESALREAVAYKFNNRFTLEQVMSPYHPADEFGFPGQFYVNVTTGLAYPPQGVWDENANKLDDVQAQKALYGGIGLNVYANANGYTNNDGNGVKFYLTAAQIIDRTRPVQGGSTPDASTVFKAIPGAPPQTAPTAYSGQRGLPAAAPAPGAPATPGPAPGNAPSPAAAPAGYPAAPAGPGAAAPYAAASPSSTAPVGPQPGQPYPYQR